MIVVTVILAAAVSSYSGNIIKPSQIAPTASFNIEIRKDVHTSMGNVSYMTITEVTGDKIPSSELKIITTNPHAKGNQTREILPNINNTKDLFFTSGIASPFLNVGSMTVSDYGSFGQYLMEPGKTVTADEYSNYKGAVWEQQANGKWDYTLNTHGDITGMQAMFADWGNDPANAQDDTLHEGDIVTIKIMHLPSNKIIFTKDVIISK